MRTSSGFILLLFLCFAGYADAHAQRGIAQDTIARAADDGFDLYVPNTFVPNGEIVDHWSFHYSGPEIESFEVAIYNRWGERLFYSTNPNFQWYGKDKNDQFYAQDTYVYKTRIVPHGLPAKNYTSHFSLIR